MTTARSNNFCEENTKPAEQGSQHHLRDQDFYYALSDFLATSLHQRLKTNYKEVSGGYYSLADPEKRP